MRSICRIVAQIMPCMFEFWRHNDNTTLYCIQPINMTLYVMRDQTNQTLTFLWYRWRHCLCGWSRFEAIVPVRLLDGFPSAFTPSPSARFRNDNLTNSTVTLPTWLTTQLAQYLTTASRRHWLVAISMNLLDPWQLATLLLCVRTLLKGSTQVFAVQPDKTAFSNVTVPYW